MSPLSRLAKLLTLKEKAAWDFYLQVKKEFDRNPPAIPAITKCITQNRLSKPTPHQVAAYLKGRRDAGSTSGTAISKSPPKPNPSDLSAKRVSPALKPPPKDGPASPLGTYHKQRRKGRSGDSGKYNPRVGALRPGHDTRVYNKLIPRCPHGVLITKKCAICDPAGFESSGGTD